MLNEKTVIIFLKSWILFYVVVLKFNKLNFLYDVKLRAKVLYN